MKLFLIRYVIFFSHLLVHAYMHIKIDILIYHLRLLYRLGEVDILYALRHINYLLNKNATDLILKTNLIFQTSIRDKVYKNPQRYSS